MKACPSFGAGFQVSVYELLLRQVFADGKACNTGHGAHVTNNKEEDTATVAHHALVVREEPQTLDHVDPCAEVFRS